MNQTTETTNENESTVSESLENGKLEVNTNVLEDNDDTFRLKLMRRFFEICLSDEDGTVSTENYLKGFDQLNKFLKRLGMVFGWVADDVSKKISIVQGHLSGANSSHYQTVQSMLDYEVSNNVIQPKASDSNTGSRNLLRLHRALEYIIALMGPMLKMKDSDSTVSLSKSAYNSTLAKYHPLPVRTAARLAMHTLPSKGDIVAIGVSDKKNSDELLQAEEDFQQSVVAMQSVYDIVQEIYAKHNLLKLP